MPGKELSTSYGNYSEDYQIEKPKNIDNISVVSSDYTINLPISKLPSLQNVRAKENQVRPHKRIQPFQTSSEIFNQDQAEKLPKQRFKLWVKIATMPLLLTGLLPEAMYVIENRYYLFNL